MSVWYHFSSIPSQRKTLRFVGFFAILVALITTLLFAVVSHAAPATSRTVSFQGRLLTASGAVVPDGHYNMQFKIYQNGTGAAADNPGGTLQWTENYVNNGGPNGVEIKNGFFSVALGSVTPFGATVDWNQDSLFLSMNIAGSNAACTTIGSAPCAGDGEMLPMKRITATPYSINSGAVGGKTANDLVQLGQGTQTDTSNNSSIAINKTGTGNLVQLQASGTDAFTVNNAGSITMGASADQSLSVATSSSGGGKSLTVSAGSSASGSNQAGGDLLLQGGAGDGTGTNGNVIVKTNGSDTTGTFQVQNTAGEAVFSVDTANTIVSVGSLKIAGGTPGGSSSAVSLWGDGPITGTAYNDGTPLNVGTTFKSDKAGQVMGVKFYNPYANNGDGGDIGKLWACNTPTCMVGENGGTELASVIFTDDGSEGWKTALFSTPIAILPDTYYIVTYFSQGGAYYAASSYFANMGVDSNPLHAPGSNVVQNGSYNAGSAGFPKSTYGSANYWVDVVFEPSTTTDQISTDNDLAITSAGAMTVGPTSSALKLQGSSITIGATNGGNVTVQGGNATASDGNGGSILLSGGAGNGTGASGLVVLTTPTFSTVTNDANCYTSGAVVASSCSVTQATVDNSSAVMVGFSGSGKIATLPDPTIKTAGRIIYVMAAGGSKEFTLTASGGTTVTLSANTTSTMLWNGTVWTTASGSGATTLQNAYNNSTQNAGGTDIALNATNGGLVVSDSQSTPVQNGTLLAVKSADTSSLFSVNSKVTGGAQNAGDGLVHDAASFATNWPATGAATAIRSTTDGQESGDSAQITTTTAAGDGVRNRLAAVPAINSNYRASVYVKLVSGASFSDLSIRYSPDGGTSFVDCGNYTARAVTAQWTQISCDVSTTATAASSPYLYLTQPTTAASARVFLLDNLSFSLTSNATPNVKVGSGSGSGQATLFTLDKADSAPTAADNESLLGSMYYDTAIGKVQCYELTGWGACGSSPDNFVTLSPEYSNAVMNGADLGTITSDLCSDALNINDGSNAQPTICGTNETYNFYNWTSNQTTNQTRSIYVTYQLPSTFKKFAPGTTSLMGRTDSANSSATYQIYRDSGGAGLTSCGSTIPVSSGSQTTWQKAAASGTADPVDCGFAAGDSILFRINLSAKDDANAYVSSLNFVYNNN